MRPEHIRLSSGDSAEIVAANFYGHDSSYCVAMNGTEYTVRAVAAPDYRIGDRVDLTYQGPPVAVFDLAGSRLVGHDSFHPRPRAARRLTRRLRR